jgi:hypothetical protein
MHEKFLVAFGAKDRGGCARFKVLTQKRLEQKWVKNVWRGFLGGAYCCRRSCPAGERYLKEDERFKKTVQNIINNI